MDLNNLGLLGTASETDDKKETMKEIFDYFLRPADIEQKTVLSNENIEAIIKMRAVNAHLKSYFDFTIELYDLLIEEKRKNIISWNGRGRNDMLSIVKNMQTQINTETDKPRIL